MKRHFLNRRIPTILAILLLVGGLGFASYLANTSLKITSFASPDEKPQDIRITNITDTNFTITYTTAKAVLGSITYGTTTPSQTAFDDRDKNGAPTQYTAHEISVSSLKAKTTYVFSITSGASTFLDNGSLFNVTTGSVLENPPTSKTITGTILSEDSSPAIGTLVYLSLGKDGQVLSTLTDANGNYSLSLQNARTKNLDAFFMPSDDTKIDLIAKTNTVTSKTTFLAIDPSVPTITLPQNYDFTLGRTILLPSSSPDTVSFPVLDVNPVETTSVTIETPKTDEQFSDLQPEFTGTAAPSQEVEITIQSSEQKVTVTSSTNGSWSFRPETPLEPGQHTITIKTKDKNGLLRQITRSFIVLAEGSQFTEPSVSPKQPSSTPTPGLTTPPTVPPTEPPSPSPTVEETPTPEVLPTEEIILLPTEAPTPSLTPRPSIQPTGSSSLNTVGLISFAFITLGVILLLFTKGFILRESS
ncbi:MAG: Ig-like domain-containing protein [bacterium]|nr:Ig-like domain-containing protein [bacterium]